MTVSALPPAGTTPLLRNRVGTVALVLGIVALIASLAPFASYVAWAIGIAAIVVGIVALTKPAARKGGAVAGVVLGALAVVLSIVLSVVYTVLFVFIGVSRSIGTASRPAITLPNVSPPPSVFPSEGEEHVVVYRVSGTDGATVITYRTTGASGSEEERLQGAALPWTKRVVVAGGSASTFTVTAQRSGQGRIACEISVDGDVVARNSSTGQTAAVSCSASTG